MYVYEYKHISHGLSSRTVIKTPVVLDPQPECTERSFLRIADECWLPLSNLLAIPTSCKAEVAAAIPDQRIKVLL